MIKELDMPLRRALLAVLALAGLVSVAPAVRADKLDKDAKKWLDEVAPLILPEEEKTFKNLKDKADRDEFQKIFWARRNPQGPASPDNPAKADFDKLRPQLDQKFKGLGQSGSATDCARVFVLLGEPNETKKDVHEGGRPGEIWTYKDRPGLTFAGGQIQIPFDSECKLPQTSGFLQQLQRPAEARIVSPNIGYRTTADGHLVKLVDLLPKPSPAQSLLKEPRQDFPLSAEPKLVMRGKEGATYVGGLAKLEPTGLTVVEDGGKKKATVVVAAQALDDAGHAVASSEQETTAAVGADGAVVGSFGLTLKPGKYTLRVGALDAKSGKGSAASLPVELPDFSAEGLAASDLLILTDIQERQAQDPKDPLAAFFLGTAQLIPRFGNLFSTKDSIQVLAFVYNGQVDPATGKPQVGCTFVIKKEGGGNVSNPSEEQVFDAPAATPGIGPVPLDKFKPGKYVVQRKVNDKVAKKDLPKAVAFEVTP